MNLLKAILIAYFVLSAIAGVSRVIAATAKARRPMVGSTVVGTVIGLSLHAALIAAVVYA